MRDILDRSLAVIESLPILASVLAAVALVGLAAITYTILRRYLLRLVARLAARTATTWDDAVLARRVLERLAALAPLLIVYFGLPLVPHLEATLVGFLTRMILAFMVAVLVIAVNGLLGAANDVYSATELAKGRPIKGYVQIVQIFVSAMGVVLIVAAVLDRSPWGLLTGIGAMTAVLMLIFQDTIRSFVASLQIATNDMVRIGDWVSLPQYGADGDVIDIALHTVKIQNWDKTISTVPTYRLIEGSLKNWRGMEESGGRRIKRSFSLDMTTVRFLGDEDLDRFEKFVLLEEYIKEKREQLERYNAEVTADRNVVANARKLTNLGTLRAYIKSYLRQIPEIDSETMTFLVRQLAPGPTGIPIEIYIFSKDQRWAYYEAIQADIFDHVFAILPEFDLRVFQEPTGADFRAIRGGGDSS